MVERLCVDTTVAGLCLHGFAHNILSIYQQRPLRPCRLLCNEKGLQPVAGIGNEITQQELAERISVTRQIVNAIEFGKYSPSLEDLMF